jgi:rod shape-determining protein MreB
MFRPATVVLSFDASIVSLRELRSGKAVEVAPVVALERTGDALRIVAVGAEARSRGHLEVNPFNHPRVVVHDVQIAAALLRHLLNLLRPSRGMRLKPRVIVHPCGHLRVELTAVEREALLEVAFRGGASAAFVWEHPEPIDPEAGDELAWRRSPSRR